jgi:hypothetical protein
MYQIEVDQNRTGAGWLWDALTCKRTRMLWMCSLARFSSAGGNSGYERSADRAGVVSGGGNEAGCCARFERLMNTTSTYAAAAISRSRV